MVGKKIEGSRKRGRPNMRWTDSIKEAIGLRPQELPGRLRPGHYGHHSFIGSPGVRADSTVRNIQNKIDMPLSRSRKENRKPKQY